MSKRYENRPGYKNSKVGWIPEEWEVYRLKNVAALSRGKFSARPRNDPYYYVHGSIPFVQTGDVSSACKYVRSHSQTLNIEGLLVSKVFPAGTILITIAANIGDVGIIAYDMACPDSLVGVNTLENCNQEWLFYFLLSQKHSFESLAPQNAQKNINLEILSRYPIPLPPLPEQKKIAEILSTWDRAVEITNRLITNYELLKKGLMQQLLTGRMRFAEFGKPARRKGELPEGWERVQLGKCLNSIVGGGTPSKTNSAYWNGEIPWATVKDVSRGNILDTIDHISNAGLKYSSANLVPAGTVLICTRMAVGATIRFDCATAINQDLKALFPKGTLNNRYLLVILRFHEPHISSLGGGSTVKGIRLEALRSFQVLLPALSEQLRIAAVLTTCDREIRLLTRKRDRLQEQKKGLMQKLLTGEIRHPEFLKEGYS